MLPKRYKNCVENLLIIFIFCVVLNEFKAFGALQVSNSAARNSWPPMKNFDIWDIPTSPKKDPLRNRIPERKSYIMTKSNEKIPTRSKQNNSMEVNYVNYTNNRQQKVLNFFPVPVDDECLSEDGRRTGTCLNVYECRLKGGTAKGECALGFGVCCVFVVPCDQEISNNITYVVSPNFPSSMPNNLTSCRIRIKMLSNDISQIRLDFYHFSLGQPNRKTGVCDGDSFKVTGGPGGPFVLCGQNSGQHVYYDVGKRVSARQAANAPEMSTVTSSAFGNSTSGFGNLTHSSGVKLTGTIPSAVETASPEESNLDDVEILMNFTNRFLPSRLWEIRVIQIPFSQRAPVGCLQYFLGTEGIIQTFNFADNGRHLANQNYKVCFRQESEMCSIAYEPCDGQSFRIGPTKLADEEQQDITEMPELNDPEEISDNEVAENATEMASSEASSQSLNEMNSTAPSASSLSDETMTSTVATTVSTLTTTTATQLADENPDDEEEPLEEVEGSGGGEGAAAGVSAQNVDIASGSSASGRPIRRPSTPAPVSGGFDIFGFFRRTFFDFRRRKRNLHEKARQFYTTCTDRITMPCIIEDFIGPGGMPTLPDCEPVHCGNKFCSGDYNNDNTNNNINVDNNNDDNNSNNNNNNNNNEIDNDLNCRVESTVTPFYLGVHFGDGIGKGSPEDNIGACLRFIQMPCM